MKKKIDKIIMDDFNENYSININKEKIYNNLNIENNQNDNNLNTIIGLQLLIKRLKISLTVVIVCLIFMIGINVVSNFKENYGIVSDDFEEYMIEYSGNKKYELDSMVTFEKSVNIYIYVIINNETKLNYYFYYVSSKEKENYNYIKINNIKTNIKNASFGLLCEIPFDQDNKEIRFIIGNNGLETEYKIG